MYEINLATLGITYACQVSWANDSDCYDPNTMDCLSDPSGCYSDCKDDCYDYDCLSDPSGCDSDCK